MSATLTGTSGTITPMLLVDTKHAYKSQNRIHTLASGRTAVTLGTPSLRRGTLGFLIKGEAAKQALVDLHMDSPVVSLADPAQPTTDMVYVLDDGGDIAVEQLMEQADLWMVRIGYQEVGA